MERQGFCMPARWLRCALCAGLMASLLLTEAAASALGNPEYRCTPYIRYECTAAGCETMNNDNGFRHAESFAYRPQSRELSACLWTNCYAASRATVFADPTTGTVTAIGRLIPVAHPGNEPIIVSLTIKTGNTSSKAGPAERDGASFTAVWGYGSEGLALDMGKCLLEQ